MRSAAHLEWRTKRTAVARMAAQRMTSSPSASTGAWRAKKMPDQARLSPSCTKKSVSAAVAPPNPALLQTSHAATAMNTYSVLQTGPNTHAAGCHDGFSSDMYQFGMPMDVNQLPTPATAKHAARNPARARIERNQNQPFRQKNQTRPTAMTAMSPSAAG